MLAMLRQSCYALFVAIKRHLLLGAARPQHERPETMKGQTMLLAEGKAQKLAELYVAADEGRKDWQICQSSVEPSKSRPADWRPMADAGQIAGKAVANSFTSRTSALRRSASLAKAASPGCSEKGHWGFWKMELKGQAVWQGCLPFALTAAANAPKAVKQAAQQAVAADVKPRTGKASATGSKAAPSAQKPQESAGEARRRIAAEQAAQKTAADAQAAQTAAQEAIPA